MRYPRFCHGLDAFLGWIKVNIHKLLLAFEALAKVELGGLDGGHGCAAVRELDDS
jgi:hypothetical protein